MRLLRSPYSYAFLVASNLELLEEFEAGPRRVGGSIFIAMFLITQVLFLDISANYFLSDQLGGRYHVPLWALCIAPIVAAWFISGSTLEHGESLAEGHNGKWPTLFAIYLIPGVGIGLTLYWDLYIPFAIVHTAILWFLHSRYRRFVVQLPD